MTRQNEQAIEVELGRCERCAQLDLHVEGAGLRHARAGKEHAIGRTHVGIEQSLEGEDHVVGGERNAVVPGHAVPQMKRPAGVRLVHLPLLGELRNEDSAARIDPHQALLHEMPDDHP